MTKEKITFQITGKIKGSECFKEFRLSNLVILYFTVALSIPVTIGLSFRQETFEDTKGIIKAVNRRKVNIMAKRKKDMKTNNDLQNVA